MHLVPERSWHVTSVQQLQVSFDERSLKVEERSWHLKSKVVYVSGGWHQLQPFKAASYSMEPFMNLGLDPQKATKLATSFVVQSFVLVRAGSKFCAHPGLSISFMLIQAGW